mgnify:CR=1 FL=1|tara:strand:- start:2026 stop:2484 length:459 start_codon:yes stop_codon:yes gene_type:complete
MNNVIDVKEYLAGGVGIIKSEYGDNIDGDELMGHYEWYVDDAEYNGQEPLNWEEYKREIEPYVIEMILEHREEIAQRDEELANQHAKGDEDMNKPTNDFEALCLALELAVTAPSEEKSAQALTIAEDMQSRLTEIEVRRATKFVEEKLGAME